MPLKEKTIERMFWTIGEVAEDLGVNTSVLRYWEKEFGMLRPKRTGKGDRLYTKEDIAKVREIQRLLKDEGFTIQGARERLRSKDRVEDGRAELIGRLRAVREQLLDMRAQLAVSEAETLAEPA
ncbi:MAG: MerR family transcriptional regulator [Flavobacteriales bacterium]|mgnify:FL=1